MLKGWTGNLILAIVAAGVGSGFQHGYNTGVLNAPQKLIQNFIEECDQNRNSTGNVPVTSESRKILIYSLIVGMFSVGGLIGALSSGVVGKTIGRRNALLYNNILAVAAALLMGFCKMAHSFEMLIIGRLIIGINCGLLHLFTMSMKTFMLTSEHRSERWSGSSLPGGNLTCKPARICGNGVSVDDHHFHRHLPAAGLHRNPGHLIPLAVPVRSHSFRGCFDGPNAALLS